MSYTCIRIEGGLISPDFLENIHEQEGQKPTDFGLEGKRSIIDEVSSVWSDSRVYWSAYKRRLDRSHGESETTITREQWVIPLLEALGYELTYQRKAPVVDGWTYAFSHRAGTDDSGPPVHIVGSSQDLGSRPPSGRGTMSPHALIQDYLNRTEDLWGVVTNGKVFRFLRDSSYFTRPTYIEFDLEQILEGEHLDEFILFYRLAHRTRLPEGIEDVPHCLLERYHQDAIEQGGRIRDGLRDAVEAAIKTLGNGFLTHRRNDALREKVESEQLAPGSYYKQLLYLIYRVLFFMVAEDRGLISTNSQSAPSGVVGASDFYADYFSFSRLRKLADTPLSAPGRFDDLYLGLKSLFFVLRDEKLAAQLGLPPLNGELFNILEDLEEAFISNEDLLDAIASFSYFTPRDDRVRRRVNYGALDVEEFGSVYESLLDYQPVFNTSSGTLVFDFVAGTERKTTGSYYTRPELVKELVGSALVPVMEDRLKKAGNPLEEKEKALLSIRVCDPACGSGHFLLAAARRLARELAKVRTETEEPSPEAVRTAVRDVITHCIYGVDKNPLAVDLCKVALWIEGHGENKPLTFLDHRIRCGDSLVGVLDMKVLEEGIPDDAYKPVTGDEKQLARDIKKRNKREREGEQQLPFGAQEEEAELHELIKPVLELSDDTPEAVRKKRDAFEGLHSKGTRLWHDQAACNIWTSAFFTQLSRESDEARHIPTTNDLWSFMENEGSLDARTPAHAWQLQSDFKFFHWPLEFPDVFDSGGFDVVLCNPPWDMLQFDPREFFMTRAPEIAKAPTTAISDRMIEELKQEGPDLYIEYAKANIENDWLKKSVHTSGRFPLTARGRINLAPLFAGLSLSIIKPEGYAGLVIPTGIATDSFRQAFFNRLIEEKLIVSLYDFENREAIFPSIHRSYKFLLLTIRGEPDTKVAPAKFSFFLTRTANIQDDRRLFTLTQEDFIRLNPNTRTCPVFRTKIDAEITKKIYKRVSVLVNEKTGENPWGIKFLLMFMMNTDSHLFRTRKELEREGYSIRGNRFTKGDKVLLPLYEGKMFQPFDHRAASSVTSVTRLKRPGQPVETNLLQHIDPEYLPTPQYFIPKTEVNRSLGNKWQRPWLLAIRKVTSPTNERTVICTILPNCGAADSINLCLFTRYSPVKISCLLANINCLPLDYVAKQKVGGVSLNLFYIRQLPVLSYSEYSKSDLDFIIPRVMELVYTSWDIKSFADDVWRDSDENIHRTIDKQWEDNNNATGCHKLDLPDWANYAHEGVHFPPFRWDDNRRAILRAELDAYYAKLYGLTEEELRYILDPTDIYGDDFPGETFRVLKNKEIKQFGEYRTKRLVIEAWNRLNTKDN